MLQVADTQRARARGTAGSTGAERRRVEAGGYAALGERVDAAQQEKGLAGGRHGPA